MLKSKNVVLIGGLIIWVAYTVFYQLTRQHVDLSFIAGYMALVGEVGLDAALFIFCLKCLRGSDGVNKKILVVFAISFLSAVVADGVYNVLLNIASLKNTTLVDSLYDVPFIFFLLFQVIAWYLVLKNTNKLPVTHKKIVFFHVPYVVISILILSVFLFGVHWKLPYFTVTGVYQIIDTLLEAIGFCLAAICITRGQSNFIKLLGIGYLIIISSDFIIRSEVINNIIIVDNFLETTWILGLLVALVSFIVFYAERKENAFSLNPVNSISSFTGSSFLVFSLLLALTTCVIILSFDNQLSIAYLPSLFVIFAIFSIVFTEVFVGFINRPIFDLNVLIKNFNNTRKILTETLHSNLIEIDDFNQYLIESFKISNSLVEQEKSMSNVATQVAHDLNNYLYTLHDAIKKIPNISKRKYEELTYIIADIDMMAENLLKYRDTLFGAVNKGRDIIDESSHIIPLPIISQVRKALLIAQARVNANEYNLLLTGVYATKQVFSCVNAVEFRRIMINLINNANEARPKSKQIDVKLSCDNNNVIIQIADDGKGIPAKVLEKLGHQEISCGKHNGHGVGVYNAAIMIKKWGGHFSIDSTENVGTTITIKLPLMRQSPWDILALELAGVDTVVVVDDDKKIHQQWCDKFENHNVNIREFCSPTSVIKHYENQEIAKTVLFLVDYQYGVDNANGIEMIESLSIASHSILVTGRSDEYAIIDECKSLGVKLLSKNMIDLISIET